MMQTVIVTGSSGLIGSETAKRFAQDGLRVVGIDNDMRAQFFGAEASTKSTRDELLKNLREYEHHDLDIRNAKSISALFAKHRGTIRAVVHTAAQPSHDWAAREPQTDFTVNANGTLNLLEAAREHCPGAPFVFTSTNKVYGDTPNRLPLRELETRWEIEPGHTYETGISESMSIDSTKHSLFGASKVAADVLVQEYGRYFGMPTVCFRGGCLTGPNHAGAELHGFLAYLARVVAEGRKYRIFGYKGKQVRDNIHAADVCRAIVAFAERRSARARPGAPQQSARNRTTGWATAAAPPRCAATAALPGRSPATTRVRPAARACGCYPPGSRSESRSRCRWRCRTRSCSSVPSCGS